MRKINVALTAVLTVLVVHSWKTCWNLFPAKDDEKTKTLIKLENFDGNSKETRLKDDLTMSQEFVQDAEDYTAQTVSRVKKLCQQWNWKDNQTLSLGHAFEDRNSGIFIDDFHHLAFCSVPKTGCTTWKRLLMSDIAKATGKKDDQKLIETSDRNTLHRKSISGWLIKPLGKLSVTKQNQVMQTYTKFFFVRHPLARLVSAYRDKVDKKGEDIEFVNLMSKGMYKFFSKRYPVEVKNKKSNQFFATFEQFLRFVLDTPHANLNEHWARISDLCNVCKYEYDYIGRFEHLWEDSNDFVARTALLDNRRFKLQDDFYMNNQTNEMHIRAYFKDISPTIINELYKKYEVDFLMFNFSKDSWKT